MCTERAGDGQEEDLKTETSRLSIPIVVLSSYNNSIICNRRTVGKQRRLCQVPKGRREPASSVQADKEEQSQIKIFLGSGKADLWRKSLKTGLDVKSLGRSYVYMM